VEPAARVGAGRRTADAGHGTLDTGRRAGPYVGEGAQPGADASDGATESHRSHGRSSENTGVQEQTGEPGRQAWLSFVPGRCARSKAPAIIKAYAPRTTGIVIRIGRQPAGSPPAAGAFHGSTRPPSPQGQYACRTSRPAGDLRRADEIGRASCRERLYI